MGNVLKHRGGRYDVVIRRGRSPDGGAGRTVRGGARSANRGAALHQVVHDVRRKVTHLPSLRRIQRPVRPLLRSSRRLVRFSRTFFVPLQYLLPVNPTVCVSCVVSNASVHRWRGMKPYLGRVHQPHESADGQCEELRRQHGVKAVSRVAPPHQQHGQHCLQVKESVAPVHVLAKQLREPYMLPSAPPDGALVGRDFVRTPLHEDRALRQAHMSSCAWG